MKCSRAASKACFDLDIPPDPAGVWFRTINASKLFPGANEPTWSLMSQTCAPPRVARKNSVVGENCWLAKLGFVRLFMLCVGRVGRWNAKTLEAMLAFWIAFKIEGEKPPETSVPNPTCFRKKEVDTK